MSPIDHQPEQKTKKKKKSPYSFFLRAAEIRSSSTYISTYAEDILLIFVPLMNSWEINTNILT